MRRTISTSKFNNGQDDNISAILAFLHFSVACELQSVYYSVSTRKYYKKKENTKIQLEPLSTA